MEPNLFKMANNSITSVKPEIFFHRDMWSKPVYLQNWGVPSAAVVVWWMERLPRWSRWAGLWQLHLPSLQWVHVGSDYKFSRSGLLYHWEDRTGGSLVTLSLNVSINNALILCLPLKSLIFSASSCEVIEVEMCQGLSYNLTSFPNIWLSIADQREAAMLLRQYRVKATLTHLKSLHVKTILAAVLIKLALFCGQVLMELACFKPLQRLVCGMFLPLCSPQGGVLQPCRSVCSSAEQQCSQALDLFSFSWPFNCHLLPDSQNPTECSQPWRSNWNTREVPTLALISHYNVKQEARTCSSFPGLSIWRKYCNEKNCKQEIFFK